MSNKIYLTSDEIGAVRCDRAFQETTINWDRGDTTANICTTDPTVITKLKKLVEAKPEECKCYCYEKNSKGEIPVYFFEMPISYVMPRASRKSKLDTLSTEKRSELGARLAKSRKKPAEE